MCRSSLSCEAQSACDAIDDLEFAIALWEEIGPPKPFNLKKFDALLEKKESFLIADFKSLWEALTRIESSGL